MADAVVVGTGGCSWFVKGVAGLYRLHVGTRLGPIGGLVEQKLITP